MKPTIWHGCYDDGWKGLITPESFSHPAKFARGLIERIYDHLLVQGYVHKGDLIGDCFGGAALGGIVAAYRGLRWVGVELEPRFVELAKANIERHRYKLGVMGKPIPQILQGDSRHFAELVAGVSAAVTSPPYCDQVERPSCIDPSKVKKPGGPNGNTFQTNYGTSPGQIGSLKSGTVQAVCTSPPYATIASGAGGLNTKPPKKRGQQGGRSATSASQDTDQKYGQTPGQIARLSEGKVASIVTSPPWEKNCEGVMRSDKFKDPMAFATAQHTKGHGCSVEAKLKAMVADKERASYGDTAGQIGQESSENYWSAMKQVYASVWQSLKPGGVLVVVIKDYCRAGKRVPLCDDTLTLLTHLGFVPLERIRAMLVKETREQGLNGEEFVSKTERKSFFRRLHEAKMPEDDERRINWEEVLIVIKTP